MQNQDLTKGINVLVQEKELSDLTSTHKIEELLEEARQTQNPLILAKVYSADDSLCHAINEVLAKTIQDTSMLVTDRGSPSLSISWEFLLAMLHSAHIDTSVIAIVE